MRSELSHTFDVPPGAFWEAYLSEDHVRRMYVEGLGSEWVKVHELRGDVASGLSRRIEVMPSLDAPTFPCAGEQMTLEVRGCAPSQIGCLWFGASDSGWSGGPLPQPLAAVGLTGCTLYVSPDSPMPLPTDSGGMASLAFVIPADASLIGAAFYNQYASADPGANPGGATLTNGAVATIGEPRPEP